ncbi:uncharacterized protein LOC106054906 [Biomphalaria glabrata]|uniref:Uncharacterized protein LOC106054906 n=1 Tax=Biomphalaria glabrata TaxID=6526 RepID=A0A9W3BQE3_BIOGL|nr:uncharacterized protein LOC106054906 [Biomphalaria glabrata]
MMACALFSSKTFSLMIVVSLVAVIVVLMTLSQNKINQSTKNVQYFIPQVEADKRYGDKFSQESMTGQVQQHALNPKDGIDNSGALCYLIYYADSFDKTSEFSGVDPNERDTIDKWWKAAAMIDWYWNSPVEYKCTEIVAVGNYDICQDSRFIIKPSCLVYSFGIDFRYSFDDAMSNLGCEVHSFDPSMGVETHKRANNSTFHNIGISHSNNDSFAPRQDKFVKTPQVWKMRTLQTLMKELGHEEKVIDVLKLDIEGYEWTVIDNLIETNVIKNIRQFVMEIHLVHEWPAKADYVHLYQIHTKLREMGFQKFTVRPYSKVLVEGYYANQVEISFVNVLFQPR